MDTFNCLKDLSLKKGFILEKKFFLYILKFEGSVVLRTYFKRNILSFICVENILLVIKKHFKIPIEYNFFYDYSNKYFQISFFIDTKKFIYTFDNLNSCDYFARALLEVINIKGQEDKIIEKNKKRYWPL